MTTVSALLYAIFCLGLVVFQFCLVAGAPWGHITQGGTHRGPLPVRGRMIAAVSAVLLIAMAASILSAGGMCPHWPQWTAWCAVGIQAVSMLLNWITPSRAERLLWGPVTTAMLILALLVVSF